MKSIIAALFLSVTLTPFAQAQFSASPEAGPPTRTTFMRLVNNANAILIEPETLDAQRSRIVFVVTHPENINNFNYFTARTLPRYGYRAIAINYYGSERSYYEFLAPISAAIKAVRALPGVEKVILVGHSTGGPQLSFYADVAENGPKACQEAVRVYKCQNKEAENLERVDGVILMDANAGAIERTTTLNPAIDPHQPRKFDESLYLFSPKNGYDPKTGTANYTPEFLRKFIAAQRARSDQLIREAEARLAKIDKGEGDYPNDEPFIYAGNGLLSGGSKPELAYINLLSKTHAPHKLLKADGTAPTQIFTMVKQLRIRPAEYGPYSNQPVTESVRNFLSFQALRLTPDYNITIDNITGVQWRSTPNSIVGNLQGVRAPTLIMSGTCAPHIVFHELAYELSASPDKEYVGVEGADHGFMPCRPEFGDTFKRAFDYVDNWLMKPGRFL